MAIIVDKNTKVLVQGITGREGSFHTKLMLEYGTKILAGVTPGKGGNEVHGVPVYDSVSEALMKHPDINASIVFVPARFAADAVYEAIDNGIKVLVVITEGIPLWDELKMIDYARRHGVVVIGPNTPGIIVPGETKIGIMPGHVFTKGEIGIVSRSGTLTYEIARELNKHGLGQSTVLGLGGDPITGLNFIDVYKMFLEDNETKAVVIVGEIGGDAEERLADYIKKHGLEKPVVAYIAGKTAPPGKRMGHAGAIISMGMGTWDSKKQALEDAGVPVADKPSDIPVLLKKLLEK
ncbi:succinate--CoA ligase subunit alpha [Desulfurococcaceae archaeon MEX13E-LK6-19]|nr:succinate--CoA ligase subunit alpha [Desulfurococcaceae archaeon MEX13E-LK6-19]